MSQGNDLEPENTGAKKPRPKRAPMQIYQIGALSKMRLAKVNHSESEGKLYTGCAKSEHASKIDNLQSETNFNKYEPQSEVKTNSSSVPIVFKSSQLKPAVKHKVHKPNSSSQLNIKEEFKPVNSENVKKNNIANVTKHTCSILEESKAMSTHLQSPKASCREEAERDYIHTDDVINSSMCTNKSDKPKQLNSFPHNKKVDRLDKPGLQEPKHLNNQKLSNKAGGVDKNNHFVEKPRKLNPTSIDEKCEIKQNNLLDKQIDDIDVEELENDFFVKKGCTNLLFSNSKNKDYHENTLTKKSERSKSQTYTNKSSMHYNEKEPDLSWSYKKKNSENISRKKSLNSNKETGISQNYNSAKYKDINQENKLNKRPIKLSDNQRVSENDKVFSKHRTVSIKNSEKLKPSFNSSSEKTDVLYRPKGKFLSSSPISACDEETKLNKQKSTKRIDSPIKLKKEDFYELEKKQSTVTPKESDGINLNSSRKDFNNSEVRHSPISKERNKNIGLIEIPHDKTERGSDQTIPRQTEEVEITKYINYMRMNDSLDESSSQSQDSENDSKRENPMAYIDFQESASFENSQNKTTFKNHSSSMKMQNLNSFSSGDEKWSPAQRQRRKRSKPKEINSNLPESPGRRGIIQITNSNTPMMHLHESSNNPNIHNVGQKLLFNPNNPSKPVAVTPSARDLPSSWDNSAVIEDKSEEGDVANVDHNLIDANSERGSKMDPAIFYSIEKGEYEINYYVNSNQLPREFTRIMDIRKHLQNCFCQLLITDIRYCQERNIENLLWKSLYYLIIEKLREYIAREPALKIQSLASLHMLVEDGLEYLQKLLKDIQNAYRFSLENNLEEDFITVPGAKNRIRVALLSCQKILLCMGDLARYKEQYSQSPNFNSAKTWYEKALQVYPRNGRPFNQLAIIAVTQKRPLDVVYFYIRSLTAANPFTSARDSLISMFEDIRKKYEGMEKIPSNPKFKNVSVQQEELSVIEKRGSLRQEIWIRPDSGATNKRTLTQSDHEEERNARISELLLLPPDQLMKHFLTGFLHCHGMLFSRVGLEYFVDVMADTLNLFQVLLKLSPARLSPTHLLQIMAVNMFAVDNTQSRGAGTEVGLRSAAQANALILSQEMFARLAETIVALFPKNFNYCPVSNDDGSHSSTKHTNNKRDVPGLFMPQLAHFIPAAKVWCDWLLYQSNIWHPPANSDLKLGLDPWGVIGELATIVKGIGAPDVAISDEGPNPQVYAVTLPEDSFLKGYTPLLQAHRNVQYVPKGTAQERARDWVRICKLQLCLGEFLCGVVPPVLRLQKTDQGEIIVPVVAETPPDSPSIRPNRDSISSSDIDVDDSISDFDTSDEEVDFDKSVILDDESPMTSTVRLLAIRKKKLEKKQRQQRKMQALMEGSITLEMEVRPRYLVPDTNCFIEHLDIIEALVKKSAYTMMVPLIVLSELDGLSKDTAVEKYGDVTHAVNVREGAAAAFHYITSTKHSHLKCVTSQGSILSSTRFTSEIDIQPDVSNDDKILSCCLQYCGDTHQRRAIKKGVRRLYREVVLLTEDRNLRVKAYSRDVPVRDLMDFAHWAGIK